MANSVSISDSTRAAIKPNPFPFYGSTRKEAKAFSDSARAETDKRTIARLRQQAKDAKARANELMKKASVAGSAPSVNKASLEAQRKARDAESELNLALKGQKQ